jgi:hypothetical protein
MGLVIPTTSLSDSPTWKTWTLEEALVSGIFNIGGNAATVQIIYGTQGNWQYEDPVNLAPGSYTVKKTPSGIPLIGLRAYNAVSGQVAVIDGEISGVYDPELNVNSLSTVNVTGNVVVTSMPNVIIAGTPNVNIANTPAVTVSSGAINIANTPAVTIASGSVNVANTPSVNVASGSMSITSGTVDIGTVTGTVGVSAMLPPIGTALLAFSENYTATSANYQMITAAPVSGFPAVMFMVKPVTRSTWFSFQVGISGKYHMAEIQQYVPLNTFGTFVLPTLWGYANMIAITSQNGDGFTAGVWPVTEAPGCYPATPYQPLIYQWPTAYIAAGASATFDLSGGYYGPASLVLINSAAAATAEFILSQVDTSGAQIGASYDGYHFGNQSVTVQTYIPPGRTRLVIYNNDAVNAHLYYACLTALPKTLAVS